MVTVIISAPVCTVFVIVILVIVQVMRRLWSTLACLGITRVYITGAEKVEKAYFGARILEPCAFMKELIIGGYTLTQEAMGGQWEVNYDFTLLLNARAGTCVVHHVV